MALYQKTLATLGSAKTKQEIAQMIEATDTPDWISIDANGNKMTRADAQKSLEGILVNPPGKRTVPEMDVIWFRENGGKASIVMWISVRAKLTDDKGQFGEKGKVHDITMGSLVRDTLILTPKGWRRTMHEKLLPDQPLSLDGAPRIRIPGVPPPKQ